MQTAYNLEQAAAFLGMLADNRDKHTGSFIAKEALVTGRAVVRVPNTSDQVQMCKANYATLTASADLSASNSTIITVGGVATVAEVYSGSHAATMALIVAKVAALSTVSKAVLDTTNNKIIHVWTTTAVNDVTGATTGGSAVTWAAAASVYASDIFGIVQHTGAKEGVLPGNENEMGYVANSVTNILRKGAIWVNFVTAFDPDKDTLYVRHTAATGYVIGDFANTATNATSLAGLPIRVIDHLSAAGMGRIEINFP